MNKLIFKFENIINVFPDELLAIDEDNFKEKSNPHSWSKKEILGHLIDSAITNYIRFIKGQFQENPQLFYEQNQYCKSANYQECEKEQLIDLWTSLNKQLLFLFKTLINQNLTERKCNDHTFQYLMQDYTTHLEHHRDQIRSMPA